MTGAPILSRDTAGEEHHLRVVDHPTGMVAIVDDEVARIMTRAAAIELAVELIRRACPPGALSSTF